MGALLSHIMVIQISNETRNITLKNPKTYFEWGQCSNSSLPEMSPGSRGICLFSDNSSSLGVKGVLVYEAESFTVAIYFSNPTDDNSSVVLGLELSLGKAHLDRLVETYIRMANNNYTTCSPDIKFNRVVVSKSQGTVQVSHGPIKVTATMSYATKSVLEVLLEEQKESVMEAGIEDLHQDITMIKLYLKTLYPEK
ncbi:hypothetical protein HGM15179_020896 [Zosterops borbonicus]|uniref:Uncharacterized protein n=1 Tax=Zosterops borbonicus TaxID=364589 RepID=A0A8K1D646_9PASS|nr:hypothetical protein HGM15179_020896 [Zosterops borbonicus]